MVLSFVGSKPMIDPNTAIEGVAAGLNLLDRLVKMIETARKEGNAISAMQVVASLPSEALGLAQEIRSRCQKLRAEFDGKNLDQSIDQLQKDYEWWHKRHYRLVREFNVSLRALTDSINNLFLDFVAIAHCREAEALIAKSFQSLDPLSKEIDSLVNSKATVRQILDGLIGYAYTLENKLAELANTKA
jgi:hypothetical protein